MKRRSRALIVLFLLALLSAAPASAGTRVIVRIAGGLPAIQTVCQILRCTVKWGLDDPAGQVFLVVSPDTGLLSTFLQTLKGMLGVTGVEIDQLGGIQRDEAAVPPALNDHTAVGYYGTSTWNGYVNQPAAQIIGLARTQGLYGVSGRGAIVAVIDTGVDPSHSVLAPSLLEGYDFTRNKSGSNEKADVQQSTVAVVDGVSPGWVSQSTVAVVDQSTVAVVDTSNYAGFGHGTMVAGVVHLTAPNAQILPLKAFGADGTGYVSDVIRAIRYAVKNNANVLNMSFGFPTPSPELSNALSAANAHNVICVASAGNNGQQTVSYPASYSDRVIGVASTSNSDVRSSFSNYGTPLVWVAAPGEGVVTTYPWGTYAATWGTSFSAPFVAGAAALLFDTSPAVTQSTAAQALGHAVFITSDLGHGRLDLYQAVAAWRHALGWE